MLHFGLAIHVYGLTSDLTQLTFNAVAWHTKLACGTDCFVQLWRLVLWLNFGADPENALKMLGINGVGELLLLMAYISRHCNPCVMVKSLLITTRSHFRTVSHFPFE